MSKPTTLRLAAMLWDEIACARTTLRRRITCTRSDTVIRSSRRKPRHLRRQ